MTRVVHVYRKGYYLGSTADYVCVLCGEEASAAAVDHGADGEDLANGLPCTDWHARAGHRQTSRHRRRR